jgi:antitoxin HigA-1
MRAVHPGEILREEFLEPLEMSANSLAVALHLPASHINDIVRERRGVTAKTAVLLAKYFNTSPEFWVNLNSMYELRKEECSAETRRAVRQVTPRSELEIA